jgi:hypothetical protein
MEPQDWLARRLYLPSQVGVEIDYSPDAGFTYATHDRATDTPRWEQIEAISRMFDAHREMGREQFTAVLGMESLVAADLLEEAGFPNQAAFLRHIGRTH